MKQTVMNNTVDVTVFDIYVVVIKTTKTVL